MSSCYHLLFFSIKHTFMCREFVSEAGEKRNENFPALLYFFWTSSSLSFLFFCLSFASHVTLELRKQSLKFGVIEPAQALSWPKVTWALIFFFNFFKKRRGRKQEHYLMISKLSSLCFEFSPWHAHAESFTSKLFMGFPLKICIIST